MTAFTDLLKDPRSRATEPVVLAPSLRAKTESPAEYLPDEGLVDAFRVMMMLRRPLLLTGVPGTGKTRAANYLNWVLGFQDEVLRFDAKSSSTARDLFYNYNTIGRFHAAQFKTGEQNAVEYIEYNALGLAILRAMPPGQIAPFVPKTFRLGSGPAQSIVLIDEIDKAPRDFPNDLLNELENMMFRVPELGNREFAATAGLEPLVVMTSNSEKNLPAAFLRRCVFYHIAKPDRDRFAAILQARLELGADKPLVSDILDFLEFTQGNSDLTKKPATAELLDFALVLRGMDVPLTSRLKDEAIRPKVLAALSTLVKGEADDKSALFAQWRPRENSTAAIQKQ
jgi:MoxR-like ATPase